MTADLHAHGLCDKCGNDAPALGHHLCPDCLHDTDCDPPCDGCGV